MESAMMRDDYEMKFRISVPFLFRCVCVLESTVYDTQSEVERIC